MKRCSGSLYLSPDTTVHCELGDGHHGPHRTGEMFHQIVWNPNNAWTERRTA